MGDRTGSSIRVLLDWPRVQVAAFDCWPDDARWRSENHVDEGHVIAIPGSAVGIAHDGRTTRVADPHRIVLYNRGQSYRRRLVDRAGDHCTFLVVAPELLEELSSIPGIEIADPEHRPFTRAMGSISVEDHLEQRSLVHLAAALDASLADATAADRWFELEERLVRHVGRLLAGIGTDHRRPARRARTVRRHERIVERAREILASDLERPVRLEQVAAATEMSPFHLAHVFRALTGMPMHAYRDQLRLRAALPWVLSGSRPLTEVALEVGYASPSHFTDRFRAVYGVAPTTVRRRLDTGAAAETRKITEAHPHRPS